MPAQPGLGAPPPAFGMQAQVYPGGMAPPPSQKKKPALLAVLSAVVLLVLLGGTLLALGFGGKGPLSALGHPSSPTTVSKTPVATPAATSTSSLPAGFQVYTSPGHLYRVSYPAAWSASQDQSDPEQETFQGPANQSALVDDFAPDAGVTPETAVTNVCTIFGGGASTGPTQTTIAGQSWTRMECESADGTTQTLVEAVSYQGKIYDLLFSSDQASFAQNQAQFFSIMEQSFTFL